MSASYGLDFGTSNTSIAILQDGRVRVLPIDMSAPNPAVVPSVLFVERGGAPFLGAEAVRVFIERNTGRTIVRQRATSGKIIETVFGDEWVQFDADMNMPGRFFQALKTFLADDAYVGTNVFGAFYTIQDLIAMLLRQIKTRADALFEQPVDSVVMGRPVFFSTNPQKDALAQSRLHTAARGA